MQLLFELLQSFGELPEELVIYLVSLLTSIIIGFAGEAVGMGFITRAINNGKGRGGGFAWGFWLGLIGIIVVACRPAKKANTTDRSGDNPPPRPDALEMMAVDSQMWFCPGCGRPHSSAEDFCYCGVRKK